MYNGKERLEKDAPQPKADRADAKEMIEGEFKRLRTEGGKGLSSNASKKPQGTDGDAPETAGQKMKRLAQEWKDAYWVSGSKEGGIKSCPCLTVCSISAARYDAVTANILYSLFGGGAKTMRPCRG